MVQVGGSGWGLWFRLEVQVGGSGCRLWFWWEVQVRGLRFGVMVQVGGSGLGIILRVMVHVGVQVEASGLWFKGYGSGWGVNCQTVEMSSC